MTAFEAVTVGAENPSPQRKRGYLMKKLSFAVVGAAALALAACGGQGDDAAVEEIRGVRAAAFDLENCREIRAAAARDLWTD